MVVAVAGGELALGRQASNAIGLGISFTLAPVLISIVYGRRQRWDREREVVGHLPPDRQRSALTAYAGLTQTADPVVARDAVGLLLTVNGDVMGYSGVVAVVAVVLGVGFGVLAALTSHWWAVDAVALVALGTSLVWQTKRLRGRLHTLQETAVSRSQG